MLHRACSTVNESEFLRDALHIFVLVNFAVAQPLLQVLAGHPHFFIAHRSRPPDIILLVIAICMLIPGFLVLLEGVLGLLSQSLREAVHKAFVALLLGLVLLLPLQRLAEVPGQVVILVAFSLGGLGTLAYLRLQPLRLFLTYLAIGLVVIPVNFLLNTDVIRIVLPVAAEEATPPTVDSSTPVVVVIFDELPLSSLLDDQGRIDPVRYPNFASLAEHSYWFRQATTPSAMTATALPAIVSGLYPTPDLWPIAEDYPQSLFSLLGGSHEILVLEPLTRLCPERLCPPTSATSDLTEGLIPFAQDIAVITLHILLPDDLATQLPSVSNTWHGFVDASPDGNGVDRALDWSNAVSHAWGSSDHPADFSAFVQSIEPAAQPHLYFIHSWIPHTPWRHLPSGRIYGSSHVEGYSDSLWTTDDWLITQAYQRHLMQVGFADKLFGELLARLSDTGLYDRSLIVVTADHGIAIAPGACARPGGCDSDGRFSPATFHDAMSIPLLIKLPGQRGAFISHRNVETIDILPTIADVLDIDLTWQFDGQSVFGSPEMERAEKVFFVHESFERFVFPRSIEEYNETLERKLRVFGSGDTDGLFLIGPYSGLIGQSTGDLAITEVDDVAIDIEQELLLADVDPSADFVPARIVGYVSGPARHHDGQQPHLAVALNGVVQAVTRSFPGGEDRLKFTAVVPETALRPGQNEIEVLFVSGDEEQPRLSTVRSRAKQ